MKLKSLISSTPTFLIQASIFFLMSLFFVPVPVTEAQVSLNSWSQLGLTDRIVNSIVTDPTNRDIIFAGTDNGVYRSTDGGSSWTLVTASGTNASIVAVSQSNHEVVYASKGVGMQKSIDGGDNWTDITNNLPTSSEIKDIVIDPTDEDIVYVGMYGSCRGVHKTTNGGTSWSATGMCDVYRLVMDPTDEAVLYAGSTGAAAVYKTTNAATSWANTGNSGIGSYGALRGLAIDPNSSSTIYAGTESTGLKKSTDGAVNWSNLSNSPSVQIGRAVTIDSSGVVYVKSSSVSKSADGGSTWSVINTGTAPSGSSIINLAVSNDQTVLYAATTAGVYGYGLQDPPPTTTLVAEPDTGNFTVNTPFTVSVKIIGNTEDEFNAARSTVTVSSNLDIVGIGSPLSNACNLGYTTTPTTSNPSFAGAIYGGSSAGCTIYTLTLKPNASGTGTITFTNASVKSYATNTEILDGVENASFTLGNGATPTPTPLLDFSITSPLPTYNSSYTLLGTKLATITNIFVNGSDVNSTYPSSTTWENTVSLSLGANNFTLYGKDGSNNQTATQTVTVNRHILGDINGDGDVDLIDASLFAVDWDKTENLTYNLSDMNGDGVVDLTDLSILAKLTE